MIPVEAIQQVIEDYERRIVSAESLILRTTSQEQYERVSGKREAYRGFINELERVITQYAPNNSSKADGHGENDSRDGQTDTL